MKNKIEDLRDHLFATLEALRDEEKPMEIERARAIADVGRVIVDSAKAEVAFLDVGRRGTGFITPIESKPDAAPALPAGSPVVRITRGAEAA